MLFNSLQFLIFFIIISLLYFNIPHKYRWLLLLAGSLYFYMSVALLFLPVIFVSISVSFISGLIIPGVSQYKKKILLFVSISILVIILAFFKYFSSFNDHISKIILNSNVGELPAFAALFPIGLSFHTFQLISYLVEVYRDNIKPAKNFGIFSLYVLLFTKVIAGPIERPQNLIPQLRMEHDFDYNSFKNGLMLMAFGFFKKVVIADRIGLIVDNTYGSVASQSGSSLLIAALLYSFQLYLDFSAYSEIAVGSSMILGFRLTNNFNAPYFSVSVTEFWTRWHISLSTWLRDYLFLPIAYKTIRIIKGKVLGIKPEVWGYIIATILTMFIAGLWHGDTWNFAVWGLIHGVFLVTAFLKGRFYKKYRIKTGKNSLTVAVKIIITFLLVSFAWIFFRALNTEDAVLIIKKIFSSSVFSAPSLVVNNAEFIFILLLIVFIMIKEKFLSFADISSDFKFYLIIFTIIIVCYLFGVFSQQQFIYFQF